MELYEMVSKEELEIAFKEAIAEGVDLERAQKIGSEIFERELEKYQSNL